MKKYFVIGNPINHSLSPKLHNFWFKKHNLNAKYEKLLIEKGNLNKIVQKVKTGEISGLNVTVPFKQLIIPYLEKLSPEAQNTQSVNTVYLENNKLMGHNTDIAGFELAIRHIKFDTSNKNVLILGAGGDVPSVISALKNDVAAVRLWSSSSLAEIGNVSFENAQLAAEQLLISLKIDNESGVRSNCIWSLCRLYEKLNNTLQESFVDECTKIALFDKEPSVMEEAKTALDSMGMQGFYN